MFTIIERTFNSKSTKLYLGMVFWTSLVKGSLPVTCKYI